MSAPLAPATGPLAGLRVLEIENDFSLFAGKLMADMGADVVLVQIDGDRVPTSTATERDPIQRQYLWDWHYNTSKRGIRLNYHCDAGKTLFKQMVAQADILLESEEPGELARLGLDYQDLQASNPRLIWVSISPFGREDPRSKERAYDLTILAGGGPVWMCGYDDHSLPPVRGGGNQAMHTACHFAFMSTLVALLSRERTGRGQFIDVNMHAAVNVTTEAGSYTWLVTRETVQRQTGRHAAVKPTIPTQIRCADGRYVITGIPPRTPVQFRIVRDWLRELELLEGFDQAPLLELGMNAGTIDIRRMGDDNQVRALVTAGRDALNLVAANLPAYDFFIGAQERGFQIGIVNSPEEVFEDPHFRARGFQVEVEHPELGRSFRYPGAPIRFTRTPWRIRRRAPLLGEDNAEIYGELGLDAEKLAALHAEGVI